MPLWTGALLSALLNDCCISIVLETCNGWQQAINLSAGREGGKPSNTSNCTLASIYRASHWSFTTKWWCFSCTSECSECKPQVINNAVQSKSWCDRNMLYSSHYELFVNVNYTGPSRNTVSGTPSCSKTRMTPWWSRYLKKSHHRFAKHFVCILYMLLCNRWSSF